MNNKLFARIAAAAVGVSMLSTFVFADGTASLNADKSQLTLNTTAITSATGEDATQVTMMAYLVGADATIETPYADETTTPMVALEQVAKGEVASLATINVLAEKFANTSFTQAIIKTGHNGTTGDGVKWLIGTVSTPEGKKITIMNGATAIDIDVVDGVATLPTDTKFDKTPAEGFNFTLYSWVSLDAEGKQKAEYVLSEGTTVNAADLEGVTLYAKFDSGRMIGDMNGDDDITASDYFALQQAALETGYDNLWNYIYTGATVMIGDMNGDDDITASDYFALQQAALETGYDNLWENLFVINK